MTGGPPAPSPRNELGLLLLLGALVAFGPLSIDLYLPALPAIARGLGAGIEAAQLTVTVFLAGFCLGMLCYGPLSDRFGRRPVLLGGLVLFVLASLACAVAGSMPALIAARFLQALGGGAASVLARAVARDIYPSTEAIRKLSLMAMVTAIAPLVAPLAGTAVLALGDWRATFAVLVVWGVLTLQATWRHLPESLPPARRSRAGLGTAFGAYARILRDPAALGLILTGGMGFASMFAYITAGPHYFITLHGMTPLAYSTVFAANALGIFAANFLNSQLAPRHGPGRVAGVGSLVGLLASASLLATIDHPGTTIAALFMAVSVTGLLGANCVGLLMQAYPQNAGAAAALFGASQFGFGMLASWLVGALHDGSGMPMAGVMAASNLLSMLGFLLHRWRADVRFAFTPATTAASRAAR